MTIAPLSTYKEAVLTTKGAHPLRRSGRRRPGPSCHKRRRRNMTSPTPDACKKTAMAENREPSAGYDGLVWSAEERDSPAVQLRRVVEL